MRKVYIITAGSYSAYHIVAVFTEQKEAERFRDTYNSRLDYWSEECRIEELPCELVFNHADEIGIVKRNGADLECYVAVPMSQDNPKEYAQKVAADLFAEYKARKEGIT